MMRNEYQNLYADAMNAGMAALRRGDAARNAIANYYVANEDSALYAKSRLREIIRADREAVPCGRWVKGDYAEYPCWMIRGWHKAFPGDAKPRLRWQARR